jgi:7-cyano-7-deazaguanine synthase
MSGGLDSLVSLGLKKEALNIKLALTFDYGQKSAKQEIDAARKICKHYNLKHEIIQLSWLKEITQTSLVSEKEIPTNEKLNNPQDSAMSVWVPNRNGLFLNIAGCYADSFDYDYIIIGANKEEGETFPDNTQEFLDGINQEFQFSTRKRPKVIAPLIKYMKNDIVKLALDNRIPLELTRSCYQSGEKHCGICESCSRLKKALKANNDTHYIEVLFK